MAYVPQAGSLPDRVCEWFLRNAEEELTASDIARKYNVPSVNVAPTLASAVAAEWLTRDKGDDGVKVYRRGPKLATFAPAAASSRPPAGEIKRRRLPPLDPDKVEIKLGSQMPTKCAAKGTTRHDPIFAKLKSAGMSAEGLPIVYRSSMTKALQVWCKRYPGQHYAIRATLDGERFGIWRTA